MHSYQISQQNHTFKKAANLEPLSPEAYILYFQKKHHYEIPTTMISDVPPTVERRQYPLPYPNLISPDPPPPSKTNGR